MSGDTSKEVVEALFSSMVRRSPRFIPGSSVTQEQWKSLVRRTHELLKSLVEIDSERFGTLRSPLPRGLPLIPSEGLDRVNRETLMETLAAMRDTLVAMKNTDLASGPSDLETKVDGALNEVATLRVEWIQIFQRNFDDEEITKSLQVTFTGPKEAVQTMMRVIKDHIDAMTAASLRGLKVAWHPNLAGVLFTLIPDGGPTHFFLPEKDVESLLNRHGVNMASREEALKFFDQLGNGPPNTDSFVPDEECDELGPYFDEGKQP